MDARKKLRSLFDTDDGPLPDIRIAGLSPDGVASAFDLIRPRAAVDPDATSWRRTLDREGPLDAPRDPAGMVVSGEAEPLHVPASGISAGGTVLPDSGVLVFADGVVLDYRMGPEWGEPGPGLLCELLRGSTAVAPEARIELGEHVSPEVERLFPGVWAAYRQAATPS